MAEFCEQCSKDLDFPYGDFKDLTSEKIGKKVLQRSSFAKVVD